MRFADIKDEARVVSSKAFCPLNFRITDRNLSGKALFSLFKNRCSYYVALYREEPEFDLKTKKICNLQSLPY